MVTELQERLVALVSQEPEFGTVDYTHHALRVRVVQDMLQEAGWEEPVESKRTVQESPTAGWPPGGGGLTMEILPGSAEGSPPKTPKRRLVFAPSQQEQARSPEPGAKAPRASKSAEAEAHAERTAENIRMKEALKRQKPKSGGSLKSKPRQSYESPPRCTKQRRWPRRRRSPVLRHQVLPPPEPRQTSLPHSSRQTKR